MINKQKEVKKYKNVTILIVGMIVYTVLVIAMMKIESPFGFTVNNDWIGYYAAIGGGVLTLLGVWLTIGYYEKSNIRREKISLRPILVAEAIGFNNYNATSIEEIIAGRKVIKMDSYDDVLNDIESISIYRIKNVGTGPALNVTIYENEGERFSMMNPFDLFTIGSNEEIDILFFVRGEKFKSICSSLLIYESVFNEKFYLKTEANLTVDIKISNKDMIGVHEPYDVLVNFHNEFNTKTTNMPNRFEPLDRKNNIFGIKL